MEQAQSRRVAYMPLTDIAHGMTIQITHMWKLTLNSVSEYLCPYTACIECHSQPLRSFVLHLCSLT